MARLGKKPIQIPSGVQITVKDRLVEVKGPKGILSYLLPSAVNVTVEGNVISVAANDEKENYKALWGTVRAILQNHVKGVSQGFVKKLTLIGVGYRAQVSQKSGRYVANLTLGLSHPVAYIAPKGIELSAPSNTEIEVKGVDKQLVGQVAAEIRSFRAPEPYKGKGIRYSDEHISLKETKKK